MIENRKFSDDYGMASRIITINCIMLIYICSNYADTYIHVRCTMHNFYSSPDRIIQSRIFRGANDENKSDFPGIELSIRSAILQENSDSFRPQIRLYTPVGKKD